MTHAPLTLGTAGHIDHGKTALVHALTGVDTDRLPEERKRGISIDLGYAPLQLPSGRRLSVIDVPGHERFVRTMVAGATGVDLFLLVVAANDGVMPQTIEHADVLKALGVTHGVVAITKSDVVDPQEAAADAGELLAPWAKVEVVACSARSGAGIPDVVAALERAVNELTGRATSGGETILHVDRSFTIRGAGTVVTGTLWSGEVERGARLMVLPGGVGVRVRSVHVHDEAVESAAAGQRVALNLVGVGVDEIRRGDVVATAGALRPSYILDAELELRDAPSSFRATVHHGTRETPGRLVALGQNWWQLRVERPLLARAGDRLVVRSIAPPDTLGGGVIAAPHARHHGPGPEVLARLECIRRGEVAEAPSNGPEQAQPSEPEPAPAPLSPTALALEQRLRAAGHEPPNAAELGAVAAELAALRDAGRVVRVGRTMHAHVDTIALISERVLRILESEDQITVARLRDELGTSRKYALALLEHLDASRVTLRLPDDARVARKRREGTPSPGPP
jgi:selenocysteine-specific elongation factor